MLLRDRFDIYPCARLQIGTGKFGFLRQALRQRKIGLHVTTGWGRDRGDSDGVQTSVSNGRLLKFAGERRTQVPRRFPPHGQATS
jgi:hypothetical protein